MCSSGFHFCKNIDDLNGWHEFNKNTKIFEVEAIGKIIEDRSKAVTDKIKVIREIPISEWNSLFKQHEYDKNGNKIKAEYSNGEKDEILIG